MKTAYISHPDCLKHDMGDGHPEQPRRLLAIQDRLQSQQLWDLLQHFDANDVDREALLRVHSEKMIDHLFQHSPTAGESLFEVDPDTSMNEYTLSAALNAAGAGTMAVDLIMGKRIDNAFCGVRPPGHHAERDQTMGFCFFNNIAVAAAHALEHHDLDRVAIIDFDVRFGNGTEDIFKNDQRVMICSTYEYPLYPFSNLPTVPGQLINVPLNAGASRAEFRTAVEEVWLPELEAFKPQFIFISAGFDAHWKDDIGQLEFTETDYAWVTQKMVKVADTYAEKRILSMLEGGYALDALGSSVEQHIRVLMELD